MMRSKFSRANITLGADFLSQGRRIALRHGFLLDVTIYRTTKKGRQKKLTVGPNGDVLVNAQSGEIVFNRPIKQQHLPIVVLYNYAIEDADYWKQESDNVEVYDIW